MNSDDRFLYSVSLAEERDTGDGWDPLEGLVADPLARDPEDLAYQRELVRVVDAFRATLTGREQDVLDRMLAEPEDATLWREIAASWRSEVNGQEGLTPGACVPVVRKFRVKLEEFGRKAGIFDRSRLSWCDDHPALDHPELDGRTAVGRGPRYVRREERANAPWRARAAEAFQERIAKQREAAREFMNLGRPLGGTPDPAAETVHLLLTQFRPNSPQGARFAILGRYLVRTLP